MYNDENIRCETCGNKWIPLIESILQSISNFGKHEYPYSKLNSDGSISFLMEKDSIVEKKFSLLEKSFVKETLTIETRNYNFEIIGEKEIVEKILHADTELVEYKINLELENFDTILKLNHLYNGYRANNSLLNLFGKNFELKPGRIRLFPVKQYLDENQKPIHLILAQGCQMSEMPTIQLLKIMQNTLPGIEKLESNFHFIPREVEDKLSINRYTIEELINSILQKHLPNKQQKIFLQDEEGYIIHELNNNPNIFVSDIDDEDMCFYMKYSNLSKEDLQHCQSLEVNTLFLLQKMKKVLTNRKEYFTSENDNINAKIIENKKETLPVYEKNRIEDNLQEIIKIERSIENMVTMCQEISEQPILKRCSPINSI